jgi:hypothetical protein
MNYKLVISTLVATIATVNLASASEIYKWTDDEGNVHYTDTPQSDPSERLDIQSHSTDNMAVAQQTQARLARQEAHRKELANAPQGQTPEELRAERQNRAEQCSMYRQRLTTYVESRHLYKEGADGEREYLDDAAMQSAREEVQEQIEEFCD